VSTCRAARNEWSMASWPNHLPSSNQKRFWRDPVKRRGIGSILRFISYHFVVAMWR
jgi:hypothetical protein